jgi:hypothetical protein
MSGNLVVIVWFLVGFLVFVAIALVRIARLFYRQREMQRDIVVGLEKENDSLRWLVKHPHSLVGERMEIVDGNGFPHIWQVVKEMRGGSKLKMVAVNPSVSVHKGVREKKQYLIIDREDFVKKE